MLLHREGTQEHPILRKILASKLAAVLPGLWAAMALVFTLHAQGPVSGAIAGYVEDLRGGGIAGASVEVHGAAHAIKLGVLTGKGGAFLLPALPPAEYTVEIKAEGFATKAIAPVVVELGATSRIRVPLSLAASSTTITVTPESSELEQSEVSSATESVLSPAQLEHLPVDARRWQTFALLTPLAGSDIEGDNNLLSFRGLAVTQNSSRIDGMDDDQSYGATARGSGTESDSDSEEAAFRDDGGSARRGFEAGSDHGRHGGAAYTFSQEAVREFRVSAQGYSALYGHASGGVITTVSRGGTNEIHGSGFFLLKESAFAATNPFSIATHYHNGLITSETVKPHDLRQQYGGSLSGPLLRGKVFAFYAFDQQRRGFPAVSTPEFAGFYALTPNQRALLGNRGVPAIKVDAALNYLDSLSGLVPRRQDQTVNFGKLEWQASERHRLGLQYNRARGNSPAGVRRGPVVNRAVSSLGDSSTSVDSVVARWTWSRGARLSNQASAQYGRDLQSERPQSPLPQEPAVGPGGYAPEVAIGPQGFSFGTPAMLGRKAYPDERRFEAADILTFARGRHLLQMGGDLSFVHDSLDSLSNTEGTFHYDSGTTGGRAGGLVDWITDFTFNVNAIRNGGCPSITAPTHYFCFQSFSQSFGEQTVVFDTQEWAAFVHETWRVHPRLTLGLGIRYEYEFMPLPQQPNAALDAVFGRVGATSVFPEDRNNFGPRVSLAWEPFGHDSGVVRIGYGLYSGRLAGATIRSALVNTVTPSSATRVRITPTTVTGCPQVQNQGFGYACAYLGAPPTTVVSTTSAVVFDRRFRTPLAQEGSFSLEHALGGGVFGSASYLLNLDRQLLNSVDINIAPSTANKVYQLQGGIGRTGVLDGEAFSIPIYTQRISSSYGPVTDILSNANATYHAVVLESSRSFGSGFGFRASWTWSKAIDYGQSSGAVPRTSAQFDPFSVRYDKGLASLNRPYKLVAGVSWEPKLRSGMRWERAVANGWIFAPVFTGTSGRPYSYNIYGGTELSGGRLGINGSGGATYLPTIGRNTLRLPDTTRLDLRVSRSQQLTEAVRLRLHAEAFNLLNHVNYSGINQRAFLVGSTTNGVTQLIYQNAATVLAEGLNTQPFGAYTAASTGDGRERQIQMGVRLEF